MSCKPENGQGRASSSRGRGRGPLGNDSHSSNSAKSRMTSIIGTVPAELNEPDFVWDSVDMSHYLDSTKKLAIYLKKEFVSFH